MSAATSPASQPNVNESKLADLLTRATTLFGTTSTGSSSIDEFCVLVKSEPEGPQITLRLLAHKLQSPVESEAMAALDVLQRCVETCGPSFHAEVGKFRFLNEIVKVISPKYFGVYTSARVKDRCIEMLYQWTKTLKNEPKIAEAYEMLRKQGLLRIDPAAKELEAEAAKKAVDAEKQRLSAASAGSMALGLPEAPRKQSNEPRKPILDDDRAKTLKLLLQSKKPEDLAAANQLIKESLKQDEERVERHCKRHAELEIVRNNMTLLTDMLDHYEESMLSQTPEGGRTPKNSTSDSDADGDVMAELYAILDKHRPALFRMASEIEDTEDDMLAALLRANDDLLEVLARYRHLVNGEPLITNPQYRAQRQVTKTRQEAHNTSFLVDVADILTNSSATSTQPAKHSEIVDLLSQELAAVGLPMTLTTNSLSKANQHEEAKTAFKEFSTSHGLDSELISLEGLQNSAGAPSSSSSVQKILDSLASTPAQPSLMPNEPFKRGSSQATKQMDALDLLGQEVIQKHLPSDKAAAQAPKTKESQPIPAMVSTSLLDKDDLPVNAAAEQSSSSPPHRQQQQESSSKTQLADLNDLTFPLDRFRPLSSATPLPLYQRNGINVLLLLGSDSPQPNVKVFLVSTTSMAPEPISNFKMTFSVHSKQSNSCQIRSLEASATALAAFNPILAPAVVTQLLLASFANVSPYPDALKLRFEVSYRLRDTCYSESGIEEVPLYFNESSSSS